MSTQLKDSTATIRLNTGAEIPQIGIGSWLAKDNEAYEALVYALQHGYRHIDTAAIYLNEEDVGRAIKDSGIPRKDIFVTTKLWSTQHKQPKKALEESLERLGLDYVDLFIIHWPVALDTSQLDPEDTLSLTNIPDVDQNWDFVKTYNLLQELPSTGLTKAIGVSNFSVKNLKKLLDAPSTKIIPAVNQYEIQPLLPQDELLKFCNEHGIVSQAYTPLGSAESPFWNNKTLKEISDSYGVSIAQLLINWGLKRGYVVLPKSSNPQRIEQNLKEFELDKKDFERVSGLVETEGELRVNTPVHIWKDGFPMFE